MSKAAKQLQLEARRLARLEKSLNLERERFRKLDTRRKIELGGLVIKAKLDNLSKAQILGMLILARKQLDENLQSVSSIWEQYGQAAFLAGHSSRK